MRWLPMRIRFHRKGHGHAWRIFTHLTAQERLFLYWLASQQPAGSILVEVGSYLGASACFLAAGALEVEGGARLHCVDTWRNHAMSEGVRDTWREFQRNTQIYSSQIVVHRGLSTEVAKCFPGEIQLLFLDGDHSYEGCRNDVVAWLPHLKKGGLLVMHDYAWAEGVQRVVREMVKPLESSRGRVMQNTYWARM
ncbi:MAG: class I SAM-dependent methyltransferase [Deltaproteobacteria bacterium]|nr:class I SAM-dependent methyltransferase [Deltaproteobacteria bacterium]